jgi:hypothetical protein
MNAVIGQALQNLHHVVPWSSLAFLGVLWSSLEFLGVSWSSWEFLGVPCSFLEFLGVPQSSLDFLLLLSSLELMEFLGVLGVILCFSEEPLGALGFESLEPSER